MMCVSRELFNKIREINNDEYSLETTEVITLIAGCNM